MSEEEKEAGEYYIYKIYWDDNDDVYVGHSMDMTKRKITHASKFLRRPSPTRLLHQAFERNGLDNRKYEILETQWCESKNEACKLEKVWWKKLESNLNMDSPYRTKEEKKIQTLELMKRRYEEKKEEVLAYNKIYYQQKKDVILAQTKIYYESHKEIIRERKQKAYYDNQEENIRKARERYQRNKDEINRRRRERRRKKREQASLPSSPNP